MEFKHVIINYLRKDASHQERLEIKSVLDGILDLSTANLHRSAADVYAETNSLLTVLKHVKDTTGWGLKESKDWVDANLDKEKW